MSAAWQMLVTGSLAWIDRDSPKESERERASERTNREQDEREGQRQKTKTQEGKAMSRSGGKRSSWCRGKCREVFLKVSITTERLHPPARADRK